LVLLDEMRAGAKMRGVAGVAMTFDGAVEYPYRESVLYRSDEERDAVLRVIREAGLRFTTRIGWPLGFHPSGYGMVVVDFAAPGFARALARSVPAGTESGPGIGPRCRRLSARHRRAMQRPAGAIREAGRPEAAIYFARDSLR